MKIRVSQKVHYDSGPNMTPLVDVVMVILIFLMMAGSFVGSEHFLVSNLPISQAGVGGVAPPPGFIPDEPIEIRVDARPGGSFLDADFRRDRPRHHQLPILHRELPRNVDEAGVDDSLGVVATRCGRVRGLDGLHRVESRSRFEIRESRIER